jgi:hypothetical protein
LGESEDAEETLRQATQAIDRVADPITQANLMAASGILAGLKLEEDRTYALYKRIILCIDVNTLFQAFINPLC